MKNIVDMKKVNGVYIPETTHDYSQKIIKQSQIPKCSFDNQIKNELFKLVMIGLRELRRSIYG